MNRDDIIAMAREAEGIQFNYRPSEEFVYFAERFAALVAEPLQSRITDLYRQLGEAEKQLDRQYKLGAEAKLDECILILERLHERSGGQYNYYAYAATVLKGEI